MSKVAIIGMACVFPGAPDLAAFWSNIVGGVDAIREVSEAEWDAEDHFDPDSNSFIRTYAKRMGFISEHATFDPLRYGVMPNAVAGSDPDQLIALKIAYDALADAGYLNKEFDRDRAEVIIGRIGAPGQGSLNLIQQSKTVDEIAGILRDVLAEGNDDIIAEVTNQLKTRLNACTSDNAPSVMPNVMAGRIAAKLGFRGRNLLVDAACASSMVAIETAVQDLLANRCDFALAGGVYVNSSPTMFKLFAGLGALSRTETIRPFDDNADGTLLGEGVGLICLKRYEDAVRDGDRIYATICGVASSSDGFGGSVLAPNLEGEALAMQRAYEMAGIDPRTVGLLEAHGTGTPTGDAVELQAVEKVFRNGKEEDRASWCAVGTIKSMIGHCQSASAVAGVIKTALALYHKVLPPTLNVETPNRKIDWDKHPCYVNNTTRPWIHSDAEKEPRRAAVSAFGFGGINAHAILEEHKEPDIAHDRKWDTELFTFRAASRAVLAEKVERVADFIAANPEAPLKDLAYTTNCVEAGAGDYRAAIVAGNSKDLLARLKRCATLILNPNNKQVSEIERGIFFVAPEARIGGKLAFLYPGLGSAYTNMLGDLCLHFPEVRAIFDICDSVAMRAGAKVPPSKFIFPIKADQAEAGTASLASADFAVVAVLLAEYALYELLRHLGIAPDALLGCSTGEFAAITTGGACDVLSHAEIFYQMSTKAARSIDAEALAKLKSIRVLASAKDVLKLAGKKVYLSADLGDDHIILTGDDDSVTKLCEKLRAQRIAFQQLPIAIPYHTPLVSDLVDANNEVVLSTPVNSLQLETWSCSRAAKLPNESEEIRKLFTTLFTKHVALRETVNAMYEDGVRTFVEVGPNGVLSVIVASILGKRPHISMASNLQSRSGITQLHNLLATLFTQGSSPNFDYLYSRRQPEAVSLTDGSAGGRAVAAKSSREKLLDLRYTKLKIDPSRLPRRATSVPLSDEPADDFAHVFEQDRVMESFLAANTAFYDQMNVVQEQVLKAFLATSTMTEPPLRNPVAEGYPFLNRMESYEEHDGTVVATLDISLDTDLYLLDHAIGGCVSTQPELRLYLMPLMVALEIMAQSAYICAESTVLSRIEQVKAMRRIVVDQNPLHIKLVMSLRELFQPDDNGTPSMMADYVFEDRYSTPSKAPLAILGSAPSRLTDVNLLYTPDTMFHGTRMQSVTSIDTVGDRTIGGAVTARPASGWFPDVVEPEFFIDPLLLDNSSQFVLFYLYEKDLPATALLPFFIESIEFCGPREQLDYTACGAAILGALTEKSTEATVQISDTSGYVWCRLNSINSRRIALTDLWKRFVHDPVRVSLSDTVFGASYVDASLLPEDDTVLDWCGDYILTSTERTVWRQEAKTAKRKRDWLAGRIAAKEAIRKLIHERMNLRLAMHDIEIFNDKNRAPFVCLSIASEGVNVSISHSGGNAIASACFSSEGLPGIDMEGRSAATPDMYAAFANSDEIALLGTADATTLWTAKEALFKAFKGEVPIESFRLKTPPQSTQMVLTASDAEHIVELGTHQNAIIARVTTRPASQPAV
jgi:phosphopantetheine--protein transferase-like protein